jgi:hypothetical protein
LQKAAVQFDQWQQLLERWSWFGLIDLSWSFLSSDQALAVGESASFFSPLTKLWLWEKVLLGLKHRVRE